MAVFQSMGSSLCSIDVVKILVRGGAIISLSSASTLGCRPSGLGDFDLLRLESFLRTSTSVMLILSSGNEIFFLGNEGILSVDSVVKTDENWSSRNFAFSSSVEVLLLFILRFAMPSLVLVWALANFQNFFGLALLSLAIPLS